MSSRPRRTKYGYPSEPQYATSNGWVVARKRPHQHAYEVLYRGQLVGWVSRSVDGWRWHLTWSPSSTGRAARFGCTRVSTGAYAGWQAAVSRIARTDVGRKIAGADTPTRDTWTPSFRVRGEPWVPRPAKEVTER
ncbi:MAG TPA: hypothetical protein VGX25_03900 [Actinophytocola sp.]|uniref:hypothetical protein n=1 Tax=Actinophytocola sp. TaxID=1872138 RepID=UPI002DDCFAAF|nr:hypothetical protein [Actinophytocola sp.]HEV2778521.1 hypothetical protein [Actinophytocola sp.]